MDDLLPFYAILRSIPNKLFGVIAMLAAIVILMTLPFVDLSRSRGLQFRPLSKIAFFVFAANFILLMQLGAKHVESPFIELGQISTVLYFAHFLVIMPVLSLLENTFVELSLFHSTSPEAAKPVHSDGGKPIELTEAEILSLRPGVNYANLVLSSYSIKAICGCIAISAIYAYLTYIGAPLACDSPRPWGLYFQDSATPQMEGLVELHDNIVFYLVIILFGVGWMLVSLIRRYNSHESPISNQYVNHGTLVELVWTITPSLILIAIAFPSFKLLYLMDEVSDPTMAVLAEGV